MEPTLATDPSGRQPSTTLDPSLLDPLKRTSQDVTSPPLKCDKLVETRCPDVTVSPPWVPRMVQQCRKRRSWRGVRRCVRCWLETDARGHSTAAVRCPYAPSTRANGWQRFASATLEIRHNASDNTFHGWLCVPPLNMRPCGPPADANTSEFATTTVSAQDAPKAVLIELVGAAAQEVRSCAGHKELAARRLGIALMFTLIPIRRCWGPTYAPMLRGSARHSGAARRTPGARIGRMRVCV